MESTIKRKLTTRERKKQKAIGLFIAVWEKYDALGDQQQDATDRALDRLAIAHIAAKFDLDCGPRSNWGDSRNRTIERLVAAWEKIAAGCKDPEAEEALNLALDELAVAHAAVTFEGLSGPLRL
jgi:hypothetical protein